MNCIKCGLETESEDVLWCWYHKKWVLDQYLFALTMIACRRAKEEGKDPTEISVDKHLVFDLMLSNIEKGIYSK